MRLFIAITFSKDIIDNLIESRDALKSVSSSLKLSPIENYHLTLAFLGECEVSDLDKIKNLIDNTFSKKIDMTVKGLGFFNSMNGKIVFRKISVPSSLINDVNNMKKKIVEYDLPCDTKPFKPHITLARSTFINKDKRIEDIPYKEINYIAADIVLMESIFNDYGPNTYQVIYRKPLL